MAEPITCLELGALAEAAQELEQLVLGTGHKLSYEGLGRRPLSRRCEQSVHALLEVIQV